MHTFKKTEASIEKTIKKLQHLFKKKKKQDEISAHNALMAQEELQLMMKKNWGI